MTYLRCEISEYETREVLSILYDFPDDKSSFTFRVPGRAEDVLIGKRILADALGGSGIDISLTEDDEEVEDMPIDLYDSLPKSPTGDFIPPAPFKGGVQGERSSPRSSLPFNPPSSPNPQS